MTYLTTGKQLTFATLEFQTRGVSEIKAVFKKIMAKDLNLVKGNLLDSRSKMNTKYKPKHTPQICIMTYKYLKTKYKIFLKERYFCRVH